MQLCNHTQLFFLGIPNIPRDVTLTCEVTSASVHWVSSFNGGDTQTFTVVAFNVKYGTRYSERIPDMGENTAHSNFIHNLQPSTSYSFHVSAENSHGNSSSENIICTTQNKGNNFFLFDHSSCFQNVNNFVRLKGNQNKHMSIHIQMYICLFTYTCYLHTYVNLIRYRQSPDSCNCRRRWRDANSGCDCPYHRIFCLQKIYL